MQNRFQRAGIAQFAGENLVAFRACCFELLCILIVCIREIQRGKRRKSKPAVFDFYRAEVFADGICEISKLLRDILLCSKKVFDARRIKRPAGGRLCCIGFLRFQGFIKRIGYDICRVSLFSGNPCGNICRIRRLIACRT